MYDSSVHDIHHQWFDEALGIANGDYDEDATIPTNPTAAGMLPDGRFPSDSNAETLCGASNGPGIGGDTTFGSVHDVLCGREKLCYRHPGTRAFQDLVRAHCRRYEDARCRADKTRVALAIARAVEVRGGRFLQRKNESNTENVTGDDNEWVPVDPDKVHDKISHALRIAIKSSRKGRGSKSPAAATAAVRATRHRRRGRAGARWAGFVDPHVDAESDGASLEEAEARDDFEAFGDDESLEPLDFNLESIFDVDFPDMAALF